MTSEPVTKGATDGATVGTEPGTLTDLNMDEDADGERERATIPGTSKGRRTSHGRYDSEDLYDGDDAAEGIYAAGNGRPTKGKDSMYARGVSTPGDDSDSDAGNNTKGYVA